jgi:hypothetical protein
MLDSTNSDGTSGRNFNVSVAMQDGNTAVAPVELIGAPIRSTDRHAGQVVIFLFTLQLHDHFQD